jgi:hypothetical protein
MAARFFFLSWPVRAVDILIAVYVAHAVVGRLVLRSLT